MPENNFVADAARRSLEPLIAPEVLRAELPVSDVFAGRIASWRTTIQNIIGGKDDRLLVVVGPCSVHDVEAALEYACWLAPLQQKYADSLFIVMRVYVEKPRTMIGWKGLVNDPVLDGSFRINDGLRTARRLMLDVNFMGLPVATEYVDLLTPNYLEDLVSWTAVGARTVESQAHREMASGLACPVGMKNGTTGNVQIAINAMVAAGAEHRFVSLDSSGAASIVATSGNAHTHLVLRGGTETNYDHRSIADAASLLSVQNVNSRVMVDVGHGNSGRATRGPREVSAVVAEQVSRGSQHIMGVMVESNLVAGSQLFAPRTALVYGQSITDPCAGLDDTATLLAELAAAQQNRARLQQAASRVMASAG
ncbi:MAG: 3-deoxy-7-phosphoheptulonate synthase [Gemmatimonas sp.]